MAGQGYKLFVNGNTLSASDLNTYVQQQTVMVFADSTARTTALSGVVSAGMISYLTGTNSLETYNGSAWVANGVGDVTLTGTQTLTNKTLTLPIIDNPILGYATTVTAAGTTTLTNASVNQQLFTGTTTQTVTMPVASTMTVGTRYLIENNSTGIVTVQSSGANTIVAIPGGMSVKVTSILNSGTTASSWDYEYVGFNAITGTGAAVLGTSATLTTPTLASSTLTGTLTANSSVGTSGQVLQSTATGVQWATPASGALVLLSTTTLSGSSVTFTNCFTTTYDSYIVYMVNLKQGGSVNKATVALIPDPGSYTGSLMQINYAGTPTAGQNNNGSNPWVTGQIDTSGGHAIIWEIAHKGTSNQFFDSFWKQVYVTDPLSYYGHLQAGAGGAKTGFTLGWNGSGSWGSGTVYIYGVAKA